MISEIIEKWIKGILIDGITGNLSGLFDNVNAKVGEIASDVGSTPQAWNSGIFNMLRSLSETVVLPIAAAILALVMCHELIQMITEKNNMHDFDTSMFFRWIFKSAFAILIVSNTWNIVMGVFDATQSVVNQSSGVIIGETSIHFDRLIPGLEFQLESMTIGSLLSLWFQTLVVGLTMNILSICIFLVTYGRMIEIYVVTALGPIPLATMGSSEWRSTGTVCGNEEFFDVAAELCRFRFNDCERIENIRDLSEDIRFGNQTVIGDKNDIASSCQLDTKIPVLFFAAGNQAPAMNIQDDG